MNVDFSSIELGFVLNVQTLREELKGMSIDGKRWWIASNPEDAVEDGFLAVGYDDPFCRDRLNSISFHIPVLGSQNSTDKSEKFVLLLDSSTTVPDEPGYYIEDGHVKRDGLEDFSPFGNQSSEH